MKILILGAGKVGETLCQDLAEEDDIFITIIEKDSRVFEKMISKYDIDGMCQDGSDVKNLIDAGVKECDIFIAVSELDEINLITATLAKRLGARFTVARVRGEQYSGHEKLLRKSLGINLIVNPDKESAIEIARNLRFPQATKIESIYRYKLDIVGIYIAKNSKLKKMTLMDFGERFDLLVCAIERENSVFIPSGIDTIIEQDTIYVTGSREELTKFYDFSGYLEEKPIKNIFIVGGGKLTTSLLNLIGDSEYNIKVVDNNYDTCIKLSEDFEKCTILYGDGTSQDFLNEENLAKHDCSMALTGIDEENLLMSVYSHKLGMRKIFTKLNRSNITRLLEKNSIVHTVITPKRVIVDIITSFIRSLKNSEGSAVEEFYTFSDARVEVIQFRANEGCKALNKTLIDLEIKRNILVAYIVRDEKIFFPRGKDMIRVNDRVVIVTTLKDITTLDEILEKY